MRPGSCNEADARWEVVGFYLDSYNLHKIYLILNRFIFPALEFRVPTQAFPDRFGGP